MSQDKKDKELLLLLALAEHHENLRRTRWFTIKQELEINGETFPLTIRVDIVNKKVIVEIRE